MSTRRRVRQAIVVEGKYDVIRVQSAVEALVIPTDGFQIFRNREKCAMLRRLAAARGLIVLTDSDSAGAVIRGYLAGLIPPEQLRMAYVPPVRGKEKRKVSPSKEGLLGVEGIDNATVLRALEQAGAQFEGEEGLPAASLVLQKAISWHGGSPAGRTAPPGVNGCSAVWVCPQRCRPIGCWTLSTPPCRSRNG